MVGQASIFQSCFQYRYNQCHLSYLCYSTSYLNTSDSRELYLSLPKHLRYHLIQVLTTWFPDFTKLPSITLWKPDCDPVEPSWGIPPLESPIRFIASIMDQALDVTRDGSSPPLIYAKRREGRANGAAAWHTVPQRAIVSVEHPCIIKNIDKGLRTLGADTYIHKVSNTLLFAIVLFALALITFVASWDW